MGYDSLAPKSPGSADEGWQRREREREGRGLKSHQESKSPPLNLWCDASHYQQHRSHWNSMGGHLADWERERERDHPLYSPHYHNTHTGAGTTRLPGSTLHTCHSLAAAFKVPRTGGHYESAPLTPTLRDEKPCMCVCVTVLRCGSGPKSLLNSAADWNPEGWEREEPVLSAELCVCVCGPLHWWLSVASSHTVTGRALSFNLIVWHLLHDGLYCMTPTEAGKKNTHTGCTYAP